MSTHKEKTGSNVRGKSIGKFFFKREHFSFLASLHSLKPFRKNQSTVKIRIPEKKRPSEASTTEPPDHDSAYAANPTNTTDW